MKIDFTGRGIDITDRIREFTQSKLERVTKLLDDVHDIAVVLSVEKYRHKAEIKFTYFKRSFYGTEERNDMFAAIDGVTEKLASQALKHKTKMTTKKRHTTESIRAAGDALPTETSAGRNPDREVRVIRNHVEVKLMAIDEAVEELDKFNQDFLIFRNADTDNASVVYRRKDGNVGLIETER